MTNDKAIEDFVEKVREPQRDVPRLTEDEIRQFVNDVLAGLIFTSWGLTIDEAQRVFMPIALGAFTRATVTEGFLRQLGIVYEYLKEAGPMAINGQPCFFSMRLMHKDDWAIALATLRSEDARRKELPLAQPEENG